MKSKPIEAPSESRTRVSRVVAALKAHSVCRDDVVEALVTAAVCNEPICLVGPPGTGKSQTINQLVDCLGLGPGEFFSYLLNQFSEPGEVLGPYDFDALKRGELTRVFSGRLPAAKVAFLDEIFNASSAILNALLKIINERVVDQNGRQVRVPLEILVAASNDVPTDPVLRAVVDRFPLKVHCAPVPAEQKQQLRYLSAALVKATAKNQRPWAATQCSLSDLSEIRTYLDATLPTRGDDPFFSREMIRLFDAIIAELQSHHRVEISDRQSLALYRLVRAHAWIHRGAGVERSDLLLLRHCGSSMAQVELLAVEVPRLLELNRA
jgi:MoxR-like ATPase